MTANSRSVFAAAILFALGGARVTQAQRIAPAGTRASSPAPHAQPIGSHRVAGRVLSGPRATPARTNGVHFNATTNSFVSADGSFVSLQDLINSAPGFPGLNQDLGVKAFIDPVTEWKLALARRFLRGSGFAGSGLYLLDGGGWYPISDDSASAEQPVQQQQQPQVIVVQAPPPQQSSAEASGPEVSAAEEPAKPTDVGQFVLVLQNGTQIQAVAFTRMKDRIVYITADGTRRTLSVADLNSDATERVNEERGTPFQLPL